MSAALTKACDKSRPSSKPSTTKYGCPRSERFTSRRRFVIHICFLPIGRRS